MWKVSKVILLILTTAHAKVTTSEQEHNVTKREIDQQIIGGSAVSMPTAVLILIKPDEDTTNSCSGTILSEDIILSAGHCFDIPGSYANVTTIVAGVSDLRNYLFGEPNNAQILSVERVTIHPRYRHIDGEPGEQEELIWDLALIKLSSKMEIETNPNMEAVKLPPPGMRHVGKIVRVGGWGRYTPNSGASVVHQAIDLMIKSDEKCSDAYDVGEYLPSLMFCAGERGQSTCRGDSGSGALFNWNNKQILIGVLSFGTKGCRTASVFQRVEKSLPWIFRETNLRPAYEVFDDDLLYEEYLDDVDVVAHSPTSHNGGMLNPVVLLTGGITDHSSSRSVEVYSPLGSCNKDLEDLPYKFTDHSIDIFNGEIIICGGQQTGSRCFSLDQNQRFIQHSQLSNSRLDHVGAVVSDTLTIVGGRSSSVETWNGSQWETRSFDEIEDMQSNSCLSAISKDTLLVVGGSSDLGRKHTNKMMKYFKADKDQDGVWERMEDFPGPARHGLGCAFIKTPEGDSFIIAGGTTRHNSYQDTSYLYNIQKNWWEEVGKLSHVRLGGKIVVVDGKVIMLGGSYAPTTVEEYNVGSKTWSQIEQKIKQTRGQFDAVVVPGALVGC